MDARWAPMMRLALACTLAAIGALATVAPPVPPPARATPLTHDAYVWQRRWTDAVRTSVGAAPAEVAGLRVLLLDQAADGAAAWPAVDAASLRAAGRPVTAVVRLDGARLPATVPLAEVLARVDAWRAAGAPVVGVEIDHDCATAALPDYARWLAAVRLPPALRLSVTALPAWAASPALPRVAAAVDELVLQVHAVRAPRLFEPAQARRDLVRFAEVVPATQLRVALPTYDTVIRGRLVRSDPAEVAGFVRWLGQRGAPAVRGVVWFRLPVDGDARAWPASTLAAVMAGHAPRSTVVVQVRPTGPGRADLVLTNPGPAPAPWPDLRVDGRVSGVELLGYQPRPAPGRTFTAPRRQLAAGASTVIGWATGQEVRLDAI
ncbi:MAG: DUF3142 domain-containing protein [Kofleriaceae bacterium]